jgi:paraquat-inducible protein A
MKSLIACHECDLLLRIPPVPEGRVALCSRCGAVLFRPKRNSLDRTLALNLTGVLLYAVAISFPFLAMKTQGIIREAALLTGMKVLYQQEMGGLALVVTLTCILFPLIEMLSLLYILLPLKFGRKLPGAVRLFHSVQVLKPWGMMEVFMLGILVSMVKLAKMATIIPGTALWAFVLLIFVLAGSAVSLDSHLVWEKLDRRT